MTISWQEWISNLPAELCVLGFIGTNNCVLVINDGGVHSQNRIRAHLNNSETLCEALECLCFASYGTVNYNRFVNKYNVSQTRSREWQLKRITKELKKSIGNFNKLHVKKQNKMSYDIDNPTLHTTRWKKANRADNSWGWARNKKKRAESEGVMVSTFWNFPKITISS